MLAHRVSNRRGSHCDTRGGYGALHLPDSETGFDVANARGWDAAMPATRQDECNLPVAGSSTIRQRVITALCKSLQHFHLEFDAT